MTDQPDRITSFSIKPVNTQALSDLSLLKKHSEKTGISFSFFMIRALHLITKELGLK